MRSFTDPGTVFEVIVSKTNIAVDGFALGEPTGEVECLECGESHLNIDEIPHESDCSQRFVHSKWYADTMDADR